MRRYSLALFDAVRIGLDSFAVFLSAWIAFVVYYAPESFFPLANALTIFSAPNDQYVKLSILGGVLFSMISFINYGRTLNVVFDKRLQHIVSAWCIALLLVIGILYLLKTGSEFSRGWMIVWALTTPIFLLIARSIELRVIAALRQIGFAHRRIAIVGATLQAARLLERLRQREFRDQFDVVGVFDDHTPPPDKDHRSDDKISTIPRGSVFELKQLCRREHIDAIIVALPGSDPKRITDTVERLMEVPADVLLGPDLAHFDLSVRASSGSHLGSLPVTSLTRLPMRDWAGIAKWAEDKIIVALASLLLAPLLAMTALLIKLDSPGPILFKQRRFGFNNVEFDVYKFRTMFTDEGDSTGTRQTTRNDQRVTRIGRFLRRTSIDELPQLINVWLGEMSIVGPRAHPIGMMVADQPYHELVRHYAARHRVKPGITGLAQVNGNRGEVDTQEKAERRVYYDLFYIENWSIWLDLGILLRTVVKLPFDRSAY